MQVRRIKIDAIREGECFARRIGLAASSQRQAAKAMARPIHLLLTGLSPTAIQALQALARRPEDERDRPSLFAGERGAAVLCGTRWEVFSLASRVAMVAGDDPAAALCEVAEAISACLSHTDLGPRVFHAGPHALALGSRTHVMGILNVTPDSFSDDGVHADPAAAAVRAEQMIAAGAAVIDVGGESTRPGAPALGASEEIDRVLPVIERVAPLGAAISIDTTKAEVARAALDAGACVVNDISGLRDPEMATVVARARAGLVLMHLRGTPATMQQETDYQDLSEEVVSTLAAAVEVALAAGVSSERIAVDPGIGFAKTAAQSLALLAFVHELQSLGHAILVGPSRKSFIGEVTGAAVDARLPGTLAAIVLAASNGANLVRVHDVAEARQALDIADAILHAAPGGSAYAPPKAS